MKQSPAAFPHGNQHESGDAIATSFRFHRELESPLEFIRREWRAILLFGGAFTAVIMAVILLIDQSFFYPRIESDALLYLLKAKSLATSGTTAARLATNLPPYPYASMPGVMRTPFLLMFTDFDDQLRAIQLSNLFLIDTMALISAYMFSWVLPRSRHWLAIGFAFGFMLLSPWWMANTFVPLVDAPYAVFSLLSIVIAIRAIASDLPLVRPPTMIAFAAVFVIAFLLRYTEPVVLILVTVLLAGRFRGEDVGWKSIAIATGVALLATGLLIYMNRDAIVGRYLAEPLQLFLQGEKQSIILNFLVLAVPSQVVPGFALGFSHPPVLDLYHAQFTATKMDALWSVVGFILTVIAGTGAWRLRTRMLPEFLLLVAVAPLLVVLMPSTSRYLMTYQPFFWIAFYEGLRSLSSRIAPIARASLVSHAGALTAIVLAIGLTLAVMGRGKSAGTSKRLSSLASVQYVRGVTGTYRPLSHFLQSLPRDRALLTSSGYSTGRWKLIANLDTYAVDSGLVGLTKRRDVYMVIECGVADICSHFPAIEARAKDNLCRVGEFNYDLVFSAKDSKSQAKVFRVRPAL